MGQSFGSVLITSGSFTPHVRRRIVRWLIHLKVKPWATLLTTLFLLSTMVLCVHVEWISEVKVYVDVNVQKYIAVNDVCFVSVTLSWNIANPHYLLGIFITGRNSSCRKVMFHRRVSVRGGGVCLQWWPPGGWVCPRRGVCPEGGAGNARMGEGRSLLPFYRAILTENIGPFKC